jgi:hypothetical protein
MSLYSELLAVGIAVPYHESDLYFPVTPLSTEIVSHWQFKGNVTRFTSNITGEPMYDAPFAYDPFWETKAGAA